MGCKDLELSDDRYDHLLTADPQPYVRFENKITGQILAFEMDDWMFGPDVGKPYNRYLTSWIFLFLGRRIHHLERHDAVNCNTSVNSCAGLGAVKITANDFLSKIAEEPEWDRLLTLEFPGQPCQAHQVRCGLPLPEGGFCPDPLPAPQGHRCG